VKKFVAIFIGLIVYCNVASSQVLIALLFGDKLNNGTMEFGLMGGPTFTNITHIESKLRPGFDLGLYFNIRMNDRWYLHPEASPKTAFGAKGIPVYPTGNANLDSLYKGGSISRNIKALSLPLLVRYRIAGLFFAEAGPQVDLFTQVKDEFETKVNDNDLSYENKVKDKFTRFDVGYVLGLAYKIKPGVRGMTFGLRYFGGLTDIMKNEAGTQANSAWTLNVFIPIGAGKAAAKQENIK
jgi:hypothetical protein